MPKGAPAKLKSVKVKILNVVEGTWEADENEQKAAWELYIELITRISVQELKPEEGLLREALTSLYNLFLESRDILKKYGPSVAIPKGKGKLSFGILAVSMLNTVLRPLLSRWHPLLSDYENTRKENTSQFKHEHSWEKASEFRKELDRIREELKQYARLLAEAANVPQIHQEN